MSFTPNAVGVVSVRAENATLIAGDSYRWQVKPVTTSTDYIQPNGTTWDKAQGAKFKIVFYVETAANYYIWVKARSLSGAKSYVWVSLDGDENVLGENNNGRLSFNTLNFTWDHNDNDALVTLFKGRHELIFTSIHEDLQIEAIAIAATGSNVISEGDTNPATTEHFGVFAGNNIDLTSREGDADAVPTIIRPLHKSRLTSRRLELRWLTNGASTANRWLIRVGTGRIGTAGVTINDTRDINETIVENPNGASNLSLTITDVPISKTNQPFYVAFWWRNDTDTSWNRGGRLYQFSMWNGVTPQPENYLEWLENPENDSNRILIAEIDTAEGALYLASKAWLSNEHKAYDDWLTSVPYIEESLGGGADLGDIEFLNPELTENPLNNNYRGYRCRMFIGDDRWRRDSFKLISSSNNETINLQGDRRYRIELIGDSEKFNRTFHTGDDVVRTDTVRDSIAWVMDQWELSGDYNLINISEEKLNLDLRFVVNESTTMQELLIGIALSAEIEWGVSQTGQLFWVDVINNTPSSLVLNAHNVIDQTLSIVETINPVREVVINYGNEQNIPELTQANTGNLTESLTFDTFIANQNDAQEFAYRKAEQYSNKKYIYEMSVVGIGGIIRTGDVIQIQHPMLLGSGYVSLIRRKPLFDTDTIEINLL